MLTDISKKRLNIKANCRAVHGVPGRPRSI